MTDWLILWRELVEAHGRGRQAQGQGGGDVWKAKARAFHATVQRRWAKPDSSRTFIAEDLAAHREDTVLDVGAGTGAWTCFLAELARRVTALDPSPAMLDILRENVEAAGLSNVDVIAGGWPQVDVAAHDVVLCSHALYGVADFRAFIDAMVATARRRCYLLLRAPTPDSLMAEIARHVWGQPFDSPNFQVAYNALMQLGIFANVLLEDTGLWDPWTSDSLEDALADVKRRFDLVDDAAHDDYLRELLAHRLTQRDSEWVWPRGVRSALVYWDL